MKTSPEIKTTNFNPKVEISKPVERKKVIELPPATNRTMKIPLSKDQPLKRV